MHDSSWIIVIHSILLDLLLDLSQQYSWECHYSRVGIYLYYNNMATAVYRRDKYLGAKDKSIPNGNSFLLILTLSQTSYFL